MLKPEPIRDIDEQLKRTSQIMGLIILCTIPALIVRPGDSFIMGFIVGGAFGILNGILLVKRMKALYSLMERTKVSQPKAKSFVRAGFYPRMILMIGIIALAGQIDFLSIYGVGVGLLIPTLITVIDANWALYRYFSARDAVDKI